MYPTQWATSRCSFQSMQTANHTLRKGCLSATTQRFSPKQELPADFYLTKKKNQKRRQDYIHESVLHGHWAGTNQDGTAFRMELVRTGIRI